MKMNKIIESQKNTDKNPFAENGVSAPLTDQVAELAEQAFTTPDELAEIYRKSLEEKIDEFREVCKILNEGAVKVSLDQALITAARFRETGNYREQLNPQTGRLPKPKSQPNNPINTQVPNS